jgi:capsular polysaccharide transport system ATP-binding protein
MILIEHVAKSFVVNGVVRPVLRDVNLRIEKNERIALFGRNGAGKSTLMALIAGVDVPTSGTIRRECLVSWPLGLTGGVLPGLSGRENCEYIGRIHGETDIRGLLKRVQDFAELGPKFGDPVQTYSSGMKARLNFALSIAFEFEVYLIDEITSVGDAQFAKKARAEFERLADRSGLVMVTHDTESARRFCDRGCVIENGVITEYPSIDDAINVYQRG